MRSEDEIKERIKDLTKVIDEELDTGTNDPVRQWAALKTTHAARRTLEWVLKDWEVS